MRNKKDQLIRLVGGTLSAMNQGAEGLARASRPLEFKDKSGKGEPDMKIQEQTRVREQGTCVTNTQGNNDLKISAIREVVTNQQYAKIDGIMVDLFTASAIIQVYDAINDANKEKYKNMPIHRMASVAFKMCK